MSEEIQVQDAPPKTSEQLDNERLVKSFVERYSKVRRPGVTLKFLQSFLQEEAADKVRQDAQSTFSSFGTDRMAALIYVVQEEMEKLAEENLRLKAEAEAKAEAEISAAKAAVAPTPSKLKKAKRSANLRSM